MRKRVKNTILIFVVVLLIADPAFATTRFVQSVNRTGEDYASLTLWEGATDNAGDLTDNTVFTGNWDNQTVGDIPDNSAVTWDGGASGGTLIAMTATQYLIDVTSGSLADNDTVSDGTRTFDVDGVPDDVIISSELYNDDGDLVDNIDMAGCTTSTTNYREITVPEGERHDGTATGGGACINPTASDHVFQIDEENVHVSWLEIENWVGTSSEAFRINSTGFVYEHLLIHDANTSQQDAMYCSTNNLNITGANTFVYDMYRAGFQVQNATGVTWTMYGVNVYNAMHTSTSTRQSAYSCDPNLTQTNTDFELTNCYGDSDRNNTFLTGGGGDFGASDYCAAEDTSAPGANAVDNAAPGDQFVSVTAGSENLHLKTGADLIDVGLDVGSSFPIDIDGRDRDAEGDTWDIGADEFVSAAAPIPLDILFY